MSKTYPSVLVAFLATLVLVADILPLPVYAAGLLVVLWGSAAVRVLAARRPRRAAELETMTAHFRSLLDSIVDGVVVTDEKGGFKIFNPAAERILKIGQTNTGPGEWSEAYGLFLPDEKTLFPEADLPLVRALGGEKVKDVEIFVRHDRAPKGLWLSVNAAPFANPEGRILGAVAVFRDVTEQKQTHLEVRLARDAADAASRAKSAFLANMSHEMRTPMNAILGLTELVLDTRLSSEQREYLSLVRTSGQALLALIDDSLDLSRIEAGRLALNPITFDLRDAVCDTVRSLAFQAHGKGLSLVCSLDPGLPAAVVGDPGRLGQILYNLIGNAIKFTAKGEVVVRMEVSETAGDAVTLHTSVSDTGIGIPEDKLETIFGIFEQVDPSPTRRYGGVGLGLAISSRLTELLGGRIWAESTEGAGSTFHFTAALTVAAWQPAHPGPDLAGLRALIVDDNPTHRRVLVELLAARGVECTVPDGGVDLHSLVPEPGKPPGHDVTLVAGAAAGGGGFELARDLAERKEGGEGGVVLLLTAGAGPEGGADRCEAVDACLLVPINPSELVDAVAAAAGRAPVPDGTKAAGGEGRRHERSLNILLAEDSPVNQRLARDLLRQWGHNVTVANNGREAVAAAASRTFDLVLMDVQMPEMDGLEATQMIRSQSPAGAFPIYALTAHTSRENRERYRAAGMDGYVEKPIRVEKLFSVIAGAPPPRKRAEGDVEASPRSPVSTRSPVSRAP